MGDLSKFNWLRKIFTARYLTCLKKYGNFILDLQLASNKSDIVWLKDLQTCLKVLYSISIPSTRKFQARELALCAGRGSENRLERRDA